MTMMKRSRQVWIIAAVLLLLNVEGLRNVHNNIPHPGDIRLLPFGVDVSFPMQHESFAQHGLDTQRAVYNEFMQGCRKAYPKVAARCDAFEKDRIKMNLEQPTSLQNFTDVGYKKIRTPPELWSLLQEFWDANHGLEEKESWPRADIFTNHWLSPTYILDVGNDQLHGGGHDLVQQLHEAAQPTLEDWSGQALTPTHLYGVRIYTQGSILSPHVDGIRRVTSAIINVAQDVEEPWILEVIDLHGQAQNVTMEPGDMVLYESRTVIHGRPYPLRGQYFANVFVHFEPTADYVKNYKEEEEEERVEEENELDSLDDKEKDDEDFEFNEEEYFEDDLDQSSDESEEEEEEEL